METRLILLCALSWVLLSACSNHSPDTGGTATTQQALDALAADLEITYRHIANYEDARCEARAMGGECNEVELSFSTTRDHQVKDWALYFSHIMPVQRYESQDFHIEHLNGDLQRITPKQSFQGFAAGQTKTLRFVSAGRMLSHAAIMPNYFLAAEGLQAVVVASTQAGTDLATQLETLFFAEPLLGVYGVPHGEHSMPRSARDRSAWASAEVLYQDNRGLTPLAAEQLRTGIVPQPYHLDVLAPGQTLDLAAGLALEYQGVQPAEVAAASQRLAQFGIGENTAGVPVRLSLERAGGKPAGSYQLEITTQGIRIIGADSSGVFYALQSLAALLMPDDTRVPLVAIEDRPHYQFRGLHLDVARNFHSKALVLKLLDQMAAYKLNKLHLHLADDEGWRLEIPGLPELTEIGAKRCMDLSEMRCLLPFLGAGPDPDTPVNGYYSIEDYAEILRAASARHIQVIPSLDMPGHARAAMVAMLARYKNFMAQGDDTAAREYLLSDLQDQSQYRSIQNYNDNTINVCMESSYAFIDKVLDAVKQMHAEAGHPLSIYHVGADETAGAWRGSPQCQAFIAGNDAGVKSMEDLGAYFIERVAHSLAQRGIEIAAWSDGLEHSPAARMPPVVQVNAWRPIYAGGHREAHEMLNRGWRVVVSSPDVLYFDHPYEVDAQEFGLGWAARHIDTRKVFQFMPDNLPVHAEFWRDIDERPFVLDDRASVAAPGSRYIGMQGHLWGETMRSDSRVEYMAFPRLLALAERAWHRPAWAVDYDYQGASYGPQSETFDADKRRLREIDWNRFANLLGAKELAKLGQAQVKYRLPTLGAVIENGKLKLNSPFPGLPLEYRTQQGPWRAYSGEVEVSGPVEVRAATHSGARKGRILPVNGG